MSDNEKDQPGPEQAQVQVQSMVISKTYTAENPQGRLSLQAPDDFLLCLGMLEWANEHLWDAYKRRRDQQRAGPKIQMPGARIPPPVQN